MSITAVKVFSHQDKCSILLFGAINILIYLLKRLLRPIRIFTRLFLLQRSVFSIALQKTWLANKISSFGHMLKAATITSKCATHILKSFNHLPVHKPLPRWEIKEM